MDKIIIKENIFGETEMFVNILLSDFLSDQSFSNLQIFFLGLMGTPKSWQIHLCEKGSENIQRLTYANEADYENDMKYLKSACLKIEKGKEYNFRELESYAYACDMEFNASGRDIIGQGFLTLSNSKDKAYSFVFTSYNDQTRSYYTCIYSDFKEEPKKKLITYYLFGQSAVDAYNENNNIQDVIQQHPDNSGFASYAFDPDLDPSGGDLLAFTDGWMDYVQISESDYDKINAID